MSQKPVLTNHHRRAYSWGLPRLVLKLVVDFLLLLRLVNAHNRRVKV